MILAAQHVRERDGIITPFYERTVAHGMTFGLGPAGYDVRIAETLILEPGGFSLASTIEHFDIPADLIAFVHDKSTWARLGLALQNTVAEPGWHGFLTLELTNHSAAPIQILAGMPIAQIIFHELTGVTAFPYAGKYQDQAPGAQPAILEAI
ncbi:dCTP deaminase [Xanthobacter sp. TB0136]|uniref:dCTP deaminase n=1 Tax=Xanthobacter sp. TB0136 TaxID=3459177 RepID=UPI00403A35ED